jgi:uncharacterized protein (DUF433 family)
MISVRGPNAVMVVDRTTVLVEEICQALLQAESFEDIKTRYLLSEEEIFECIDSFTANYYTHNEYLELNVKLEGSTIEIETVGLSQWTYLTLVRVGRIFEPELPKLDSLFARGIEEVFHDCLTDVAHEFDDYTASEIHCLVFQALQKAYGDIDQEQAIKLLLLLETDDE